jgi:methionyl-tRNA formyltransferase
LSRKKAPRPKRRRPFPNEPRVVFFGTSDFAVPSLRALHARAGVTLVVTQPDRPSGRGQRLQPTPVKAAASQLGIATLEPPRLRDAAERLAAERADLFAVASYGKIVPADVLALPRLGALNVHPSLLPLYRGATPLQSAIRDGRQESGVTVILMDAGMDTGDIVLQIRAPIGDSETYGELHDRFADVGAALLIEAVDQATHGTMRPRRQDTIGVSAEEIEATLTRPLEKADLAIDPSWPAARIVNAVRSLAPQPSARAVLSGERVKVLVAHVAGSDERIAAPRIAGGDGRDVLIDLLVPPNHRAMTGAEYCRMRATA